MNFYITSLLIFVINQINKAITQGVPVSPCPKIFQYRFDGSEWFGIMSLRNPEFGQAVHLKVALSMRGKPTTNYLGEIILLSRGQIESESSIVYKIKFPKNNIPPRLLQILINNRIACIGPSDRSLFVTHIHLEHTRKFTYFHDLPSDIQSNPMPPQKHQFIDHFGSKQMPIVNPSEKKPLQDTNAICGRTDERIRQNLDPNGGVANDDIIMANEIIGRGSWPWLAAVYVNNLTSLSYQCGGTLISSRIVISSAHCFHMYKRKYQANEVLIFLGRHNLKNWNEEGSIAAPCDEIYTHPDYDSNLNSYDADIAVIVLKNEIRFNLFIRPACMWSGSPILEFVEGERGVIVGWGHNNNNTSSLIVSPKKVEAIIVSNGVCFKSNDRFRNLSSNRTFCAGNENGESPCVGDSGGGLMLFRNNQWKLRGIVSASLPHNHKNNNKAACNSNEFIIYTDVAKFLDWIFAFII